MKKLMIVFLWIAASVGYGQVVFTKAPPSMTVALTTDGGATYEPMTGASGEGIIWTSPPPPFVPVCTSDGGATYSQCTFSGGGGGGVSQIIAGTNVTISPSGGTGAVTINASGGGGGNCSGTLTAGDIPFVSSAPCALANSPIDNAVSNPSGLTVKSPWFMQPVGVVDQTSAVVSGELESQNSDIFDVDDLDGTIDYFEVGSGFNGGFPFVEANATLVVIPSGGFDTQAMTIEASSDTDTSDVMDVFNEAGNATYFAINGGGVSSPGAARLFAGSTVANSLICTAGNGLCPQGLVNGTANQTITFPGNSSIVVGGTGGSGFLQASATGPSFNDTACLSPNSSANQVFVGISGICGVSATGNGFVFPNTGFITSTVAQSLAAGSVAVTQTSGDSSTLVATDAFVRANISSGTVTSIATTSPITGGTITTTGTIACATCVSASSPGAGIAHFAGSTQAVTSSPVSLTADVSGLLPVASGGTGTASPGLIAGTNVASITGTWPNQTINAATQGTTTNALTFNNTNSGAASGTTFNGSAAQTISTNTINAANLGVANTFTGGVQAITSGTASSASLLAVNAPSLSVNNAVAIELGFTDSVGNSVFLGWNKTGTNTGYGDVGTFSNTMPIALLGSLISTNSPLSIDNAGNSPSVAGFTCAAGDAACFGATANGVRPAAIGTNGAFISNVTQTTVSCSTSGTAIFSQPIQGASDKKVLIHMAACLGTASYTYPVAFTNIPSIYASNNVAASIATAVSTTAVTVTGATTTGSLILEDF